MKQRWEHWNVFSALSVNRKFLWGGSQNLLLLTHSCAHSWMVPGVRIQLLLENRPPWEETQPRAVSLSSRKGWSPLATLQLPEVPSCPREAGMEAGMGWGAGMEAGMGWGAGRRQQIIPAKSLGAAQPPLHTLSCLSFASQVFPKINGVGKGWALSSHAEGEALQPPKNLLFCIWNHSWEIPSWNLLDLKPFLGTELWNHRNFRWKSQLSWGYNTDPYWEHSVPHSSLFPFPCLNTNWKTFLISQTLCHYSRKQSKNG